MKTRSGLVSNSSSCSFTILKKDLTEAQVLLVTDYMINAPKFGMHDAGGWRVEDVGEAIELYTDMDNFDMVDYLSRIGYEVDKRVDRWHS